MYLSTVDKPATPAAPSPPARTRIAATVLALGTVSLITDVSSEMVTAILPLYLMLGLHLGPLGYGVVDGLYTGATALLRLVGGYLADRIRRRKAVAVAGYGISAVAKLGLLAAGSSVPLLSGVIVADRAGKGLRTAPRDALITLSTPPDRLGRAFGVHRAMDSVGAFAGPLVAVAVLGASAQSFDAVFVTSFCIAALGVFVLLTFVPDHRGPSWLSAAPPSSPAPPTAPVSSAAAATGVAPTAGAEIARTAGTGVASAAGTGVGPRAVAGITSAAGTGVASAAGAGAAPTAVAGITSVVGPEVASAAATAGISSALSASAAPARGPSLLPPPGPSPTTAQVSTPHAPANGTHAAVFAEPATSPATAKSTHAPGTTAPATSPATAPATGTQAPGTTGPATSPATANHQVDANEPAHTSDKGTATNKGNAVSLGAAFALLQRREFRLVVIAATVMGLATIGDGFVYLVLQRHHDIAAGWFPLLAVGTNLAYLLLAMPLGSLADRVGRPRVYLAGFAALAVVYLMLAAGGGGTVALVVTVALYGTFYAATDGVLMAVAGPLLPEQLKTTGIALVQSGQSLAYLGSSILFGAAWQLWGPGPALVAAAGVALAALCLVAAILLRGYDKNA
ncbi:MAG TPA: MFS transporter [Dactylosporangium sp.]|nr:MFS transporter [Dactylosporangium sp.]